MTLRAAHPDAWGIFALAEFVDFDDVSASAIGLVAHDVCSAEAVQFSSVLIDSGDVQAGLVCDLLARHVTRGHQGAHLSIEYGGHFYLFHFLFLSFLPLPTNDALQRDQNTSL